MRRRLAQRLESLGIGLDIARLWLGQAWKIGLMMGKGAYLLGERRQLFIKLGETYFRKLTAKDVSDADLEAMVHQVERLTKKIETEEMLIHKLRFGEEEEPQPTPQTDPSGPATGGL